MTQPEQIAFAVVADACLVVLFVVLSSCVVAVLLGPERGPGFIRRNAWMFSRPASAVEWVGLLIAASIATSTQLVIPYLIQAEAKTFGTTGQLILGLELVVALLWLGYLLTLYLRPNDY